MTSEPLDPIAHMKRARAPKMRQAAAAMLRAMLDDEVNHGECPLDPMANDAEFVAHYGLTIDGRSYDFDAYKHMLPVFEDEHPEQTIMAGAQTGKSGRVLARLIRAGLQHWGSMLGYYFPDYHLPRAFSSQRFKPMVLSSPALAGWLGTQTSGRKGTDNVLTRNLGPTTFYFLSVGGKTATEGLPLKGVFFDEVRRMSQADVELAMERYSAQVDPLDFKVSTAKFPDSDIHHYFQQGDQRYFHSVCGCADGVVLSLTFPNCVADLRSATPALKHKVAHAFEHAGLPYLGMTGSDRIKYPEAAYVCPRCGEVIVDPREGWWEPHNHGAWVHSYQLPQILSPTYPAGRVLKKSLNMTDKAEFYNSGLGLPYIDAEALPVTQEDLDNSVRPTLRWPIKEDARWRKRYVRDCAMGIDQMGGYNCCVIKQASPNGKWRTVHLEVVHGDDPWRRCAELMELFDVRLCVADQNPNFNEARRFAKAFVGRVYLASYSQWTGADGNDPMVQWGPARMPKSQRGRETAFKHTVRINRTKGLQWSLQRWPEAKNETPHPDGLVQYLPVDSKGRALLVPGLSRGSWTNVPICRRVYWYHQTRVAFVQQYTSDDAKRRGQFKLEAVHIGIDPHFAHSELYANVAMDRIVRPRRTK